LRIPEEEINAVRAKADIVEVIGKYLPVEKQGREYVALCPFHNDHSPSMHISPEKQIYKCFVCGAGGNVFSFVQNYEKISFPEAVQEVADLVGFQLSVKAEAEAPKDPRKEKLYRLMEEAVRFTMYQMHTKEAAAAKGYLDERGMTEQVRKDFDIGFNPEGNVLYKFLKAKGYEEEDMLAVNLVRSSGYGIQDVYAGRITFPIHDAWGHPIGFSARTLDPKNPSKYINTTDTELFHKSDIVYNAHRARLAARRSGGLYVCEGVTDVIAFARAGLENAVCTLGTSCTEAQIRLLKNLSPKIIFCYDGDDAGQAATWRAGHMALQAGGVVGVVKNQTKLDPDEIVRSQGAEGLQSLARQVITWPEFVLLYLSRRTNFDNYAEKKDFLEKAQVEMSLLSDDLDRQYFQKKAEELTGFRLPAQKVPAEKKSAQRVTPSRVRTHTPDGLEEAEKQILAMMLQSKAACAQFEDKLGYLSDEKRNDLAMRIVSWYRRREKLDVAGFMDGLDSQEEKDLTAELAQSWAYSLPYSEAKMTGAMRKVLIHQKLEEEEDLRRQLGQTLTEAAGRKLLDQYIACVQDLRRYYDDENRDGSNA
jgi:DNA primase